MHESDHQIRRDMMRRNTFVLVGAALGLAAMGTIIAREGRPAPLVAVHEADPASLTDESYVLDFTMDRLGGESESLELYKGKVVLMVNVASKCGLTPQYEGLQAIYDTYKDRDFVILGFPANNFGNQEPGSDQEIAEFCTKNYGVTFPMFSKISVKGEDIHPLYERLTSQPEPIGGEVQWNFQKYLINRDGKVFIKFDPAITPEDEQVIEAIESLIATDVG